MNFTVAHASESMVTMVKLIRGSVPDVCLWLGPPSLSWGFSLALTVCEFIAIFFVSSRYVYKFDCFPVMIHCMHVSKEVSTRA